MTVLQAAAILILWRSGRFDTFDIARVLNGVSEADICRVIHAAREAERGPDLRVIKS